MGLNQLIIEGSLVAIEPLRFTPIGLPVIAFLLKHESEQIENGQMRLVIAPIKVVAVGEVGGVLMTQSLGAGTKMRVAGFLAQAKKNARQLILHAQTIDLIR